MFGGDSMAHASFDGLRVLSLEARRAKEVAKLIRTYGGDPFVVPAMREVPLESNRQALEFSDRLIQGDFDLVIFFTGVGVRALLDIVQTRHDREVFLDALRKVKVAARGPKPQGALRELKIPVLVSAPEPSTWHELLTALRAHFGEELASMKVAVQEYGASNPEFLSSLTELCSEVTKVPVYQWALPEDLRPLRECVLGIARRSIDVALFMTAVQVIHLFQIAEQMNCREDLRAGLSAIVVVSIGPTTSEELAHYGITPDFEPSRPKMAFLVNEAAQYSRKILQQKDDAPDSIADLAQQTSPIEGAPKLQTIASPFSQTLPASSTSVRRVAPSTSTMAGFRDGLNSIDLLHEISSRIATADSFHIVLGSIVDIVTTIIPCDSCFIYVLEGERLVLRVSKNPHADLVDHLGLQIGQGITGWVAEHQEPVAIASQASKDPRFTAFRNVPEDLFEALLCTPILCASKVVGVINLQHRTSYQHTKSEIKLLSMIGILVGAEIERARLESENAQLAGRLETRKALDRAKGVLQRDLGVSEDEAYRRMQRESRQRRKSMREIAEAILLSDDLRKTQKDPVEQPEPRES
jgi:uroporphyrinogen-III synthase